MSSALDLITTIDLLGCEGGLTWVDQAGTHHPSMAEVVATRLRDAGYEHIRVHALTLPYTLIQKKDIQCTRLLQTGNKEQPLEFYGFTEQGIKAVDKAYNELAQLRQEYNEPMILTMEQDEYYKNQIKKLEQAYETTLSAHGHPKGGMIGSRELRAVLSEPLHTFKASAVDRKPTPHTERLRYAAIFYHNKSDIINSICKEALDNPAIEQSEKNFIHLYSKKLFTILEEIEQLNSFTEQVSSKEIEAKQEEIGAKMETLLNEMESEAKKIPRTSGFRGVINALFNALGFDKPFNIIDSQIVKDKVDFFGNSLRRAQCEEKWSAEPECTREYMRIRAPHRRSNVPP